MCWGESDEVGATYFFSSFELLAMAPNPVKPRRTLRVLDGLWYAGSAPHTLMALTALLAGTLAFAALVPQQPSGLEGAAAEQWLAGAASSFRGAGPFLRAVGAFHITGSPWMRALLAALALNLTLRVAAKRASSTG